MKRFLSAVLFVAALSACATPVKYAPTAPAAALLPSAGLPSLVFEEVADETSLGEIRGPGGYTGATFPSGMWDPSVAWSDTVREALTLELRRLGWPLAETGASGRARLTAAVGEASADWGSSGHVTSKIKIRIALSEPDGRQVWAGQLEGVGRATAGSGGNAFNGIRAAMNAALNSAIPRLGPMLASGRPWERLGKSAAAPAAIPAAPEPAPATPDVEVLPKASAARPHSYAVVVGVEHYREKLPNADFAAGDARLAAQYFERALGVPEANVALLIDDRATKSDFEKYFESWLPNRVEAGDTVYVYYSGHGAPNAAKGDAYLVPYDGDPTYIEKTGYSVDRLYAQLAKLPAKQVYVAMDSCFSGAGGRSVIASGARPLVSVASSEVPAKVTVLAASAGNQVSNSYQAKGHGLFTYFFLKGLKEKGDDFHAVFDYLKPEVARTARRECNADQDPQWRQGR